MGLAFFEFCVCFVEVFFLRQFAKKFVPFIPALTDCVL